jgi:hypothetical protein
MGKGYLSLIVLFSIWAGTVALGAGGDPNQYDYTVPARARLFAGTLSGFADAYRILDQGMQDSNLKGDRRELIFLHALTQAALVVFDRDDVVVTTSIVEVIEPFGVMVAGDKIFSRDRDDPDRVSLRLPMDPNDPSDCYELPPEADLTVAAAAINETIIPEIDAIVRQLDSIEDVPGRFVITLTPAETGLESDIEVDRGEVLSLKALLLGAKALFHGVANPAYDVAMDLADPLFAGLGCGELPESTTLRAILDAYPMLLEILPEVGTHRLAQSKQNLVTALDSAAAALDHITGETDDQDDDLLQVDKDSLAYATLRTNLDLLRDSLLHGTAATYAVGSEETFALRQAKAAVGETTVLANTTMAAVSRRAVPYGMPEAGTLESISIYHEGGTGRLILAIYDDSGPDGIAGTADDGLPGERLATTPQTAVKSSPGWQTVALSETTGVREGQTIWLAWVFEHSVAVRWDVGSPGRADSGQTWSGGPEPMPADFGSSTQAGYIYSIYASYTPGEASASTGQVELKYHIPGLKGIGSLAFWDAEAVPAAAWEIASFEVEGDRIEGDAYAETETDYYYGWFEGSISSDGGEIRNLTLYYSGWSTGDGNVANLTALRTGQEVTTVRFDPNPLSAGSVSPRDVLPLFDADNMPVAGTFGHGLGNDATLGGVTPDMTQVDWLGAGYEVYGIPDPNAMEASLRAHIGSEWETLLSMRRLDLQTDVVTRLGASDGGTATFPGSYPVYVVAARSRVLIDSVYGSGNDYLDANDMLWITNISVFDDLGDAEEIATDAMSGAPDGNCAPVGEFGLLGWFTGFVFVDNPGTWTGLTVVTHRKSSSIAESAVGVHRLWSPTYQRHFYTIDDAEKEAFLRDASGQWEYQDIAFYAFADDNEPNVTPAYRFYCAKLNTYLYTIRESEKNKLIDSYADTWTYQGVAFYVFPDGGQPSGASPVYRFWSGVLGCHFFTIDDDEKSRLISKHADTWIYEGIAWYAYSQR